MAWLRWCRLKFDVCLGAEGIGRCSRVLWWWSQRITGIVRQAPHQKHVHNPMNMQMLPVQTCVEKNIVCDSWTGTETPCTMRTMCVTLRTHVWSQLLFVAAFASLLKMFNDRMMRLYFCFYVEVAKQHSKVGRSDGTHKKGWTHPQISEAHRSCT